MSSNEIQKDLFQTLIINSKVKKIKTKYYKLQHQSSGDQARDEKVEN